MSEKITSPEHADEFNPLTTAAELSPEDQQFIEKVREGFVRKGVLPESARSTDVDVSGIRAPQYAPHRMQADMDALMAPEAERSVAEDVPLPAVFRIHPERLKHSEPVEAPIIPNPEDALDQEHVRELLGGEGTPKEWRDTLRKLITGAQERFGHHERGERLQAYLSERSKTLNTEAAAYGPKAEKLVRSIGERYGKLNWKYKIAIGAGLGISAAAFSGVSTPLALLFGAGIVTQRAAGMASMFLKFEKHLQETGEGKSDSFLARQDWYKKIAEKPERQRQLAAAVMSAAYTSGMSLAIGEAIHLASESSWGEAVHEWLKQQWPFQGTGSAPAVPEHSGPKVSGIIEHPGVAPAPVVPEVHGVVPAMPTVSVEASAGHGYEYMLKQLWKELQAKHLDPSNYAAGTDIHTLLTADAHSIDSVVHQIAADPKHDFFHADGTSVRIDSHAQMTLGSDGEVHLSEAGHDILQAPAHMPTTSAYPPSEPPISQPEVFAPHPITPPANVSVLPKEAALVSSAPHEAAPLPVTPHHESVGVEKSSVPAPDGSVLHDGEGGVVHDGEGNPVHTGAYEAPHETQAPAVEHIVPAPEQPGSPPALSLEHTAPFINNHNLSIDPAGGHVFEDTSGAVLAYGNDYSAQFTAAEEYVKAHHNAVVWVQAEKPVFYEGAWHPWVFPVKYGGWWRGVYALLPSGPPEPSQIGGIDPETFIKQLDK